MGAGWGERRALAKGFVMEEALSISTEAREKILDLIGADDKGRRFVRVFIQGWG